MPSSTSSFERVPKAHWARIVITAVLTVIMLLAAIEGLWRNQGAYSNYVDDPRRWSYSRGQVGSLTDRNSTILTGASRIQLGWSMATFRSMIPGAPIVQLAINGESPWAVLRDLSENTNFSSVVLVSLTTDWILPAKRNTELSHTEFYSKKWNTNKKANFLIDNFFQTIFVTRQPLYGLWRTISFLGERGRFQPAPHYLETTFERERNADYRLHQANRKFASQKKNFQPPSDAIWEASVRALNDVVRPMTERGARVVFIRFPTSGEHWERDKKMFPRERYWDDMASRVSGHWVHFKDIDGIDRFVLPDTSHLDKRDKAEFTRLIIERLRELGVY